jgi:lipopolysaccharide/colanic/teichoic acid biosynthesis glycosyltransferase
MKRFFDFTASLIGLAICLPLFAVVAILVKVDSRGPVFYRQERIGMNFSPFNIYKFRTMEAKAQKGGSLVTVAGDIRITRVGKYIRKYKIDEIPQLINVLKGEMSLVGPRPEVRKYVELFRNDYEKLLKVQPGITDPSSIAYINEEEVLASCADWEGEYINRVLPKKIERSLEYVNSRSFRNDFKYVVKTLLKTVHASSSKV